MHESPERAVTPKRGVERLPEGFGTLVVNAKGKEQRKTIPTLVLADPQAAVRQSLRHFLRIDGRATRRRRGGGTGSAGEPS